MALQVAAGSSTDSLDGDESGLIWAIRYLEIETVEKLLEEGVNQRYLDCGLHEIANGERDSEAHRSARLHIAARLIECGGDPDNRQHGCGGTPLHHTLAGGYVELVRFLLDAQADVNASNRYGVHPLHIAVKREYTDCIEALMSQELPPDKVREELCWAVQYDLGAAVNCLLTHGAPHGIRVLCPWTCGGPRGKAAREHGLPLGYYVVMRGWKIAKMEKILSTGWTRLQASVAGGEVEAVRALLEGMKEDSALAEAAMPYKATLLHLAVYSGNLLVLNLLLERKSPLLPPSATDCFKRSALCYAACKGEAHMMAALLVHGADPNAADADGRTALHKAAAMGHADLIRVLLAHGADPAAVDAQLNTPVHYAAIEACTGAIGELLKCATVQPLLLSPNASGMTPLHLCACSGDPVSVERLLEAEPRAINLRVKDEGTATHMTCEKGHVDVLRVLLRMGADREAHVDPLDDPRTPLHLAAEYAQEECVACLLENGASPLAELPLSFLQQFKNYRFLSQLLRRASCHAAALSQHFKDDGWKGCVQLLDAAAEQARGDLTTSRTARRIGNSGAGGVARPRAGQPLVRDGIVDAATPALASSSSRKGELGKRGAAISSPDPSASAHRPPPTAAPSHQWWQTRTHVVVEIHLRAPLRFIHADGVNAIFDARSARIGMRTSGVAYLLTLRLAHPIVPSASKVWLSKGERISLQMRKAALGTWEAVEAAVRAGRPAGQAAAPAEADGPSRPKHDRPLVDLSQSDRPPPGGAERRSLEQCSPQPPDASTGCARVSWPAQPAQPSRVASEGKPSSQRKRRASSEPWALGEARGGKTGGGGAAAAEMGGTFVAAGDTSGGLLVGQPSPRLNPALRPPELLGNEAKSKKIGLKAAVVEQRKPRPDTGEGDLDELDDAVPPVAAAQPSASGGATPEPSRTPAPGQSARLPGGGSAEAPARDAGRQGSGAAVCDESLLFQQVELGVRLEGSGVDGGAEASSCARLVEKLVTSSAKWMAQVPCDPYIEGLVHSLLVDPILDHTHTPPAQPTSLGTIVDQPIRAQAPAGAPSRAPAGVAGGRGGNAAEVSSTPLSAGVGGNARPNVPDTSAKKSPQSKVGATTRGTVLDALRTVPVPSPSRVETVPKLAAAAGGLNGKPALHGRQEAVAPRTVAASLISGGNDPAPTDNSLYSDGPSDSKSAGASHGADMAPASLPKPWAAGAIGEAAAPTHSKPAPLLPQSRNGRSAENASPPAAARAAPLQAVPPGIVMPSPPATPPPMVGASSRPRSLAPGQAWGAACALPGGGDAPLAPRLTAPADITPDAAAAPAPAVYNGVSALPTLSSGPGGNAWSAPGRGPPGLQRPPDSMQAPATAEEQQLEQMHDLADSMIGDLWDSQTSPEVGAKPALTSSIPPTILSVAALAGHDAPPSPAGTSFAAVAFMGRWGTVSQAQVLSPAQPAAAAQASPSPQPTGPPSRPACSEARAWAAMASAAGQPQPSPVSKPPAPPQPQPQRPSPAVQDVSQDWRCRCGTLNKAGTYLCSGRICHGYFCLRCGQTGHQQRYCRLGQPPAAADAPQAARAPMAGGPPAGIDAWPSRGSTQDVSKEWRCKCGTLNKVGSFICAKRGCRVYFCLGCGGMGHQQRFCRHNGTGPESSGPAPALAPAPATSKPRRGAPAQGLDLDADDDAPECVVCMDAPVQITLFPCNHNITCASCTYALLQHNKPCPYCAVEIVHTDLNHQPGPWNVVG